MSQNSNIDTTPCFAYNNQVNFCLFSYMNLNTILTVINMAVMVVLTIMISLQNKSSGLSNVFGGGGSIVQTRRGVEKWLFYATIVTAFIFVGLSLTSVLLTR